MIQALGIILLALAGAALWSPWALVIGGLLLLIAPELAAWRRKGNS